MNAPIIDRRSFLKGMAGILAASAAPAVITTPGLLMPVKKLWVPSNGILRFGDTFTIEGYEQKFKVTSMHSGWGYWRLTSCG